MKINNLLLTTLLVCFQKNEKRRASDFKSYLPTYHLNDVKKMMFLLLDMEICLTVDVQRLCISK